MSASTAPASSCFRSAVSACGSTEPRCVKPPGLVQASEYERTADAALEVRFPAKAGTKAVGIAFVRRTAAAPEGAGPVRLPPGSSADAFDQNAEMGIEGFQIEGPFASTGAGDTPSRRSVFSLPPAAAAGRGAVRQEDSVGSGPARLSPAGHRRRRPNAGRTSTARAAAAAASRPASSSPSSGCSSRLSS